MYLIKAKKINEDRSVSLDLSAYHQIKYKVQFRIVQREIEKFITLEMFAFFFAGISPGLINYTSLFYNTIFLYLLFLSQSHIYDINSHYGS